MEILSYLLQTAVTVDRGTNLLFRTARSTDILLIKVRNSKNIIQKRMQIMAVLF